VTTLVSLPVGAHRLDGRVINVKDGGGVAVGQQALTIVGRHPWSLSASLHWRH
jgi:hypothetical protein